MRIVEIQGNQYQLEMFFLTGLTEEVMHDQVQEETICITMIYVKLGVDLDYVVCESTDIERDNCVPNHTITKSRSQR